MFWLLIGALRSPGRIGRSFTTRLSRRVAASILDIRMAAATLVDTLRAPTPTPGPVIARDVEDALSVPGHLVELEYHGSGADLLRSFYTAVDPVTKRVGLPRGVPLPPHHRRGFRYLLDALQADPVGWVRLDGTHFRVSAEHYDTCMAWMRLEIVRLAKEEHARQAEPEMHSTILKLIFPAGIGRTTNDSDAHDPGPFESGEFPRARSSRRRRNTRRSDAGSASGKRGR